MGYEVLFTLFKTDSAQHDSWTPAYNCVDGKKLSTRLPSFGIAENTPYLNNGKNIYDFFIDAVS